MMMLCMGVALLICWILEPVFTIMSSLVTGKMCFAHMTLNSPVGMKMQQEVCLFVHLKYDVVFS